MPNRTIWDLTKEDRARGERRRKTVRFSLRMLLVVFTVAAVAMAIVGSPIAERRRESRIAKQFEDLGANVRWHHKPEGSVHRFLFRRGLKAPYLRVTHMTLNPDLFADSQRVIESNVSLAPMATLPHLEYFVLRLWIRRRRHGANRKLCGRAEGTQPEIQSKRD